MNSKAFEILSSLNLTIPKRYDLPEVLIMPDTAVFYLRYSQEFHYLSRIVDKKELENNILSIEKMYQEGKLIYIEEAIPSIFGACLYIDKGLVYGEIVRGHIIGLLRRGMCAQRFYIDQNNNLFVKKTCQLLYFLQENGKYSYLVNNDPPDMDKQINRIIENIVRILPIQDINGLLLEILITNDRIICCDAKYPDLDNFMDFASEIFLNKDDFCLLKKNLINNELVFIDNFDIDVFNNINKSHNIVLNNSALLSHFITRHWNLINTIFAIKNQMFLFNILDKKEINQNERN
jgi:hypothetical protein